MNLFICKNICLILGPHIYSDIQSLTFLNLYIVNILLYMNIQIFIDKYIYSYKYLLDYETTNIFKYSLVRKNIFVTL